MTGRFALALTLALTFAPAALAQTPAPAPTAAPAGPPPAPVPYPQPQPYPYAYPPQPQPYPYAYPPQPQPYPYWYAPVARPLPAEMPYDPEKPIPPGYELEERVRKGAVISGAIVLGVPYVLGLHIAAASGFENKSYWLVVPGLGPFLTLATRDDACERRDPQDDPDLECAGDVLISTVLVMDGLMQAAGGIVFAVGMTAKRQVLVRKQTSLRVIPMSIGRARGLGLVGSF